MESGCRIEFGPDDPYGQLSDRRRDCRPKPRASELNMATQIPTAAYDPGSTCPKRRNRRGRGLTGRQQRFVEEYLIDLNATQAAIRGGYSRQTARAIGSENLTKPDIRAAVERGMLDRGGRAQIAADQVLTEVARIAFSDIRDIDFGPDGKLVEGKPGAARAVATYQYSHQVRRHGHRIHRAVRLWNKVAALRLLMQHFGLLDPKHRLTLEAVLALFPPDLQAAIIKCIAEGPPREPGEPPQ
jgi:phage terminase small subunit